MNENLECRAIGIPRSIDISDEDVYVAMKGISGYLDITPGDFKEVYRLAYKKAVERLTSAVKAVDIMNREVVFVHKNTPTKEVARSLGRHGISGLPVVDDIGTVEGVISEKDFLMHMGAHKKMTFMEVVAECLLGDGCVALSIRGKTAADIMTSPAVTVHEETSIMEIADIFTEKNINRVPVINQKGNLVGIVSRNDILQSILLK